MTSRLLDRVARPVRGWEARRALRAARRSADEEIRATRLPPPRLAWRTKELRCDGNRVQLGSSLTDVVHTVDQRLLPSASPLDRGAVRECRAQLLELASRLFDLDRPVTARGVLLVEALLVDGTGPLYNGRGAVVLRRALDQARKELDGPGN